MIEKVQEDIERLAREINLEEKHIERLLNGTYAGVSLTRHIKGKRFVLLARVHDNATGKVNYPIIKSTGEDNHEMVAKIEKFVKFFRVYKALKKAEEMIAKAREELKALMS